MKSKGLISLSLALVMLFTLVVPVLAGKPTKGTMTPEGGEFGTAKYALQVTHDDDLKVTVALRGAVHSTFYELYMEWRFSGNVDPDGSYKIGEVETNIRGSGRVTVIDTNAPAPGVDYRVRLRLKYSPFTYRFYSDWVTL